MNTKYTYHITLFSFILSALIWMCACQDVLDVENLGSYPEKGTFDNEVTANAYLARLYDATLSDWPVNMGNYADESGGMYGLDWITTTNGGGDADKEDGIGAFWPYATIRNINIFLKEMPQGAVSESKKAPMIAQAKFLRAFLYFKMIYRYGGVPISKEPQKVDDDLKVSRNTSAECFDFIIQDLNEAYESLPNKYTGNDRGRIDKAIILSFKGRVMLYKASPQFNSKNPYNNAHWQEAYNANKAAIDFLDQNGYGLLEDYTKVFETKGHKENVLSVIALNPSKANARGEDAVRPLSESKNATAGDQPIWKLVMAFSMKDGKKTDDPTSKYNYEQQTFWKDRDPRFEAVVVWNGAVYELSGKKDRRQYTMFPIADSRDAFGRSIQGESSYRTGLYCRKGIMEELPSTQVTLSDIDWPEIRYTEVLINYAESANEVGKTEIAYEALKAIRKRAGIEPGNNHLYGLTENLTREQMRETILNEKYIEMCFEGHRFWDLRRHRKLNELNGMHKYGPLALKVNGKEIPSDEDLKKANQYQLTPEDFTYEIVDIEEMRGSTGAKEMFMPDKITFFPIKLKHIDKNSNLKQNKDWGGDFDPEL